MAKDASGKWQDWDSPPGGWCNEDMAKVWATMGAPVHKWYTREMMDVWTMLCQAPESSSEPDLGLIESFKWGKLGDEVELYIQHVIGKDGAKEPSKRTLGALLTRCREKVAAVVGKLKKSPFQSRWCEWKAKSEFLRGCSAVFRLQQLVSPPKEEASSGSGAGRVTRGKGGSRASKVKEGRSTAKNR